MNYLINYTQPSNSKNALHDDIDVFLKKYNRITVFDSDLLDFTNYIREQVEILHKKNKRCKPVPFHFHDYRKLLLNDDTAIYINDGMFIVKFMHMSENCVMERYVCPMCGTGFLLHGETKCWLCGREMR